MKDAHKIQNRLNEIVQDHFNQDRQAMGRITQVQLRLISERLYYLEVVLQRCTVSTRRFRRKFKAYNIALGKHGDKTFYLSREEVVLQRASDIAQRELIIDTEAFYERARTLLEHVAKFTYFYFGPSVRLMRNLNNFASYLPNYAKQQGLSVPDPLLLEHAQTLHKDVHLFYNNYLSHQDDDPSYAHVIKSVGFSEQSEGAIVGLASIYPRDDAANLPEGRSTADLFEAILSFLNEWCDYLEKNKNKARYYDQDELTKAIWRSTVKPTSDS